MQTPPAAAGTASEAATSWRYSYFLAICVPFLPGEDGKGREGREACNGENAQQVGTWVFAHEDENEARERARVRERENYACV